MLRNRLALPFALLSLSLLVACGSSSNTSTPPPSGAFSNSNLNGTYGFSIVGSDSQQPTPDFLAIAGQFTADGKGNISGGALDINDSGFTTPVINNPITGGSYQITSDGRGQALFTTTTPFGSTLKVDFVLTSSEHGMITQYDSNGTGSGTLDLQTSTAQPAAGNYVLALSGISGIDPNTGFGIPAGTVGLVTLDASGNATGSMDYNDNSTPSNPSISSPSVVTLGGSPGKAVLHTSGGTIYSFDVYPISSTHMKFIETDAFPILAGDLFSQPSAAFPSGQLVFTMAGFDFSQANSGPVALGGFMTSDGTTISNGSEDFDDVGTVDTTTPQGFAGLVTPSGGRSLVQFTSFVNGAAAIPQTYTFAAYPSSGGVQMIEVDGGGVTAGAAFQQSATSPNSSTGFGFNLTASNSGNGNGGFEEDDIAEFTLNSTNFSGLIDVNDQGTTGSGNFDQTFNGTITMDSTNSGRGILSNSFLNGAVYTVDASTMLFLETDGSTQLGVGGMEEQNASAKSNLAASHLAMLRLQARPHKAWKRRLK